MKLKEVHIRNIASIERADIDFEKDLCDAVAGTPAPIFLISGDTGAGKSVLLDSISMALYKKTPRIADVANVTKNEYTDAEGEQIRVASIEQYTRLGISDKDDSYSEVIFEGNDGRTYHARLTLGMKLGAKDKETGIRPLKHRKPVWEVCVGNGDWSRDSVEQTLLDAVGLDFQQFGRMAMLAQGQFANFLTGDKKEREAILEQLTNTRHFTAYGEAISSLWKKAKDNQSQLQTCYDTERPHSLSDEEVEQLTQEQQADQQKKEALDDRIKQQDDRLKLVELVLHNERLQEEARQKKQALETVMAGEEYQRCKALFTEWDATTTQRQTLADLQKARQEEQNAKDGLRSSYDIFQKLSADIADRRAKEATLSDSILQTQEWIDKRKQHESLFSTAGETDLKIAHYLSIVKKAGETASLLNQEKAKTEALEKARAEAAVKADLADKAVRAKESEIDALSKQRAALHPQAISDQTSQKEGTKRSLEDLRKAFDNLTAKQKKADELRNEIKVEEEKLKTLNTTKERAEADYQAKRAAAEAADKRLTTMQMSVNDTIVALRHRLHDQHIEICPLCGGNIDHSHLDDDFRNLLTPLEQEQQQTARALAAATRLRDETRDAFVKSDALLRGKVRQLEKADKKNTADKQDIENNAVRMELNVHEPLLPQIDNALATVLADIEKLKATQKEAERLQDEINKLLHEKKTLDKTKADAEKAKTRTENEVKANVEAILRLEREHTTHLDEGASIKAELNVQLADYAANWLTDTDRVRRQLKDDAKEYAAHLKQLSDTTARHDKARTLADALAQLCDNILHACPDWQTAQTPQTYPCRDISAEWTALLSKVTALTSKLKECKSTIAEATATLAAYYQESREAVLSAASPSCLSASNPASNPAAPQSCLPASNPVSNPASDPAASPSCLSPSDPASLPAASPSRSPAAVHDASASCPKTEQTLLALIAQEPQVAAARRFVAETDSQLHSRNDAIADAAKQIDAALNALNITHRSQLPDKLQLEEQQAATRLLRDEVLSKMAQTKNRLDTHRANIQRLKDIERQLQDSTQRFLRWDKLNRIFGGTRFRTLVQTYILRPLLNNANIYLHQITDRYHLTCSQDNEQLSILVLDRYNKNQVRSVTVLSGGERFMISLALSLALSSLNRPDMNVNILFIDEGFGTLDEKSLDSVMATLEKLQEIAGHSSRRVGIISHREELEERIPVRIQVVKKGEGRSLIEMKHS